MNNEWYKDRVFYQIWPRSFRDGNNDGIGDLYGVYESLDYLKSLGIGGIWFSPLYPSPNADYGYDISDYKNIHPDYGDLEIFRKVLDKAHELDIKVIMDLVVNHTSDEHEWFVKSRDEASPYRDYYFWRKGKKNGPPNNWDSFFAKDAWSYDPATDAYYLHLFHEKQVDLNMDNPKVREEVKDIMRFWLDMGVDGFREDVITFISKPEGLPDSISVAQRGIELFDSGPHIHEYLQEFRRDVLDHYDCFVVGEGPMMSVRKALPYLSGDHPDLDLMFHFQHMEGDCFFTDYVPHPFSLVKLKHAFSHWQNALEGKAWNTLYLENHDHPRVISRYGNEKFRTESGKSLAVSYMFQKGTPFVYQGQEIGMTNIKLPDISDYKDCMALKHYEAGIRHKPKEKVLPKIQKATRDNARTVMQWSDEPNAGFSTAAPWFAVNPNYPEVNVETEEKDPDSLLHFYRDLIHYRTQSEIVRYGTYKEFEPLNSKLYIYEREYEGRKLLVLCSFSEKPAKYSFPKDFDFRKAKLIFANYADNPSTPVIQTRPYECRVYEYEK